MKVIAIRSDEVYKKILNTKDIDKRNDIYRYELMNKFAYKWSCYNVPIKAKQKGGYDVIMASSMLGYLEPSKINENTLKDINDISKDNIWNACTDAIQKALSAFINHGINLITNEYKYTILLPDKESAYTKLSGDCCGDGGIPGSIFVSLIPNKDAIDRIYPVLAHECNHNVRFQYIKWNNNITLEEMMINEGIAENFATWMYGEENLGPWVTATDLNTLDDYVKPIIKDALDVQGLEGITSFLYGDEIAKAKGYFLKKTGISIVNATLMSYEDIKKELDGFWE